MALPMRLSGFPLTGSKNFSTVQVLTVLVLQQTRNPDGPNNVRFDLDDKADLLTERVEAVHYETCSGSTEKLVPSLTSTVFPGKRTPSSPLRSSS